MSKKLGRFVLVASLLVGVPTWAGSFTFYPDPDPEVTSMDGYVWQDAGTGTSWTNLHSTSSANNVSDNTDQLRVGYFSGTAGQPWKVLYRAMILFDTSAIPDAAVVSSATLALNGQAKTDALTFTDRFASNIYSSNPTGSTSMVVADYNRTRYGSVDFSTPIVYSAWAVGSYNNFVLNASGIAGISLTGVSKFGWRESSYDKPNTEPANGVDYTFVQNVHSNNRAYGADDAGTSRDPMLVVITLSSGRSVPMILRNYEGAP
jgi:hypothetical protein